MQLLYFAKDSMVINLLKNSFIPFSNGYLKKRIEIQYYVRLGFIFLLEIPGSLLIHLLQLFAGLATLLIRYMKQQKVDRLSFGKTFCALHIFGRQTTL